MKPQVSVIMAARNEEHRVGLAISSVFLQTLTDWQLVVVDDASADRTASVLRMFARADPRVEILPSPTNLGRAAARNWAIEQSRADLIAILDADDLMLPQRLQRQVDFMSQHADVGMLGTGAYYVLWPGGPVKRIVPPGDDSAIRHRLEQGSMPFVHPSMLFRRELLVSNGGYVQATPHYNEDYCLCARCIRKTRAAALPEPLIVYSCEGLMEAGKLIAKRREMVELQLRLLRQEPSLQRCAALALRGVGASIMPKQLGAWLMRRRLQQLPSCGAPEMARMNAWMASVACYRDEIQHADRLRRSADHLSSAT